MKTRILTAAVGIPAIIALVFFAPLWAIGIMMGLLCAGAAFEFIRCVAPNFKGRPALWPMLSGFVMPFWLSVRGEGASLYTLGYWLFFVLFLEMVLSFSGKSPLGLSQLMAGLTAGMVMPILLSAVVRIGLRGDCGRVNLMLPFVISFSCDGGAFFTGHAIGMHPMAPVLSPHKTMEGGIGGLACAMLGAVLYGLVLSGTGFTVSYGLLLLYGFGGGVACELGDLSFSAVKRVCGIKDYGKIIPGHGGVLDRFDSMYFTAPLLEILTFWLPAIAR